MIGFETVIGTEAEVVVLSPRKRRSTSPMPTPCGPVAEATGRARGLPAAVGCSTPWTQGKPTAVTGRRGWVRRCNSGSRNGLTAGRGGELPDGLGHDLLLFGRRRRAPVGVRCLGGDRVDPVGTTTPLSSVPPQSKLYYPAGFDTADWSVRTTVFDELDTVTVTLAASERQ